MHELKEHLDAASSNEVVRRALQIFEHALDGKAVEADESEASEGKQDIRVPVILPARSKDRLERLASTNPSLSYASIIRQALRCYHSRTMP